MPLTWLIIGTSDIVKKRAAAAIATAPGSKLLGVCGGLDRAAAIAKEHGATEVFDDVDRALAQTKADAVYIATAVYRHQNEALKSLAAGKHLLIEKPLGLNAADAAAMVDAAAKTNAARKPADQLVTGCAYYRRTYPRFAHAKQLINSGGLGKITHVRMSCHSWWAPAANDPKIWRVDPTKSGGGALADMGCHMVDLVIGLLGMPVSVYAKNGNLVHTYGVEDSTSALMTFASGTQLLASFAWSTKAFLHDIDIIGTDAKLSWQPFDTGKVTRSAGRDSVEFDLPNAANVHVPLVQDFVEAVRDRRPTVSPLDQALLANRVIDAVYTSAATGKEVAP